MKKWEHFHVALPTTDPPPDHSAKMLWRMNREMRLTMSREAVVEHLGQTDSAIPSTPSVGLILFWLGALAGIIGGLIIDKLFG